MRTCVQSFSVARLAFALFAFLLAASFGWAADGIVDTIEKSFSVSARARLIVHNVDGQTRVTASAPSRIQVKAVKEVRGASDSEEARAAAARVEVRIEQVGDRVEVEARHPKDVSFLRRRPQVLVHFEVTAPVAADLEIHAVDGEVNAEGFEGHIDLSTVDGQLIAHKCSGQIKARAVDGNLTVDGSKGEIDAQTVDGALTLEGVWEAIDARATDGSINIRALPGSKMRSEWSIRSTDGGIQLRLPEGFAADLDASSSDGDISSNHPITVTGTTSKQRLSGKLNGGGYLLRIHSSDGSIHILR